MNQLRKRRAGNEAEQTGTRSVPVFIKRAATDEGRAPIKGLITSDVCEFLNK
jgi:hypothetical protein